ncbi:MAG: DUF4157 domain-containing protein [Cyanobacteria bacterium P01_G01_bin.54]
MAFRSKVYQSVQRHTTPQPSLQQKKKPLFAPPRGFGYDGPEPPQFANLPAGALMKNALAHEAAKAAAAGTPVQAQLTVGATNDPYEQEADKVARQVVNEIHKPQVDQKVDQQPAEEKEEQTVQRQVAVSKVQLRTTGGSRMAAPDAVEQGINQARGKGQPLNDAVRQPMEQAFGADFGGVRVHTDAQADQLNQSIQAKAFTTGQDVFFRAGAYQPGSRGGQELIAHELTHVVQQNTKNAEPRREAARRSKKSDEIAINKAPSHHIMCTKWFWSQKQNQWITNEETSHSPPVKKGSYDGQEVDDTKESIDSSESSKKEKVEKKRSFGKTSFGEETKSDQPKKKKKKNEKKINPETVINTFTRMDKTGMIKTFKKNGGNIEVINSDKNEADLDVIDNGKIKNGKLTGMKAKLRIKIEFNEEKVWQESCLHEYALHGETLIGIYNNGVKQNVKNLKKWVKNESNKNINNEISDHLKLWVDKSLYDQLLNLSSKWSTNNIEELKEERDELKKSYIAALIGGLETVKQEVAKLPDEKKMIYLVDLHKRVINGKSKKQEKEDLSKICRVAQEIYDSDDDDSDDDDS